MGFTKGNSSLMQSTMESAHKAEHLSSKNGACALKGLVEVLVSKQKPFCAEGIDQA
jgi:hypothetical protein